MKEKLNILFTGTEDETREKVKTARLARNAKRDQHMNAVAARAGLTLGSMPAAQQNDFVNKAVDAMFSRPPRPAHSKRMLVVEGED